MGYSSAQFGLKEDDTVGFTEAQRTSIEFHMTFSIVDESTWLYRNFKFPRHRNFYGYAQIMAGAYVVRSVPLEFINQEIIHWHQDSTDILQSIGCGVKKILANLTPPVASQVTLYLLRQRFTSVRFRLSPGVKANVALRWYFVDQLCDELIVAPPEAQGSTSPANNKDGSPSSRPSGQGEDAKDPSNNDGKDDPNDTKPDHPRPGLGPVAKNWKAMVVLALPSGGCQSQPPYIRDYPELIDPGSPPVFVSVGESACPGTSYGRVESGGVVISPLVNDIVSYTAFYG